MIGLEFIVKTFDVKFRRVAEHLGISPTTIADWVKGRRKIPIDRRKQLTEYFGLEEEYFQKELSRLEEIEIQKEYVFRKSKEVEFKETGLDDNGEEYSCVTRVNDSEGLLQLYSHEQERLRLLDVIDKVVHADNGQTYKLDLFKDFAGLVKTDTRLASLLIGVTSQWMGIAPYVGKLTERESEFTESLKTLILRFQTIED